MNFWYHFANNARGLLVGLGVVFAFASVVVLGISFENNLPKIRWLAVVGFVLSITSFVTAVAAYAYVDANDPVPSSFFEPPKPAECPNP